MPASTTCPDCAGPIDYDRRFTPWCATCDWNVDVDSEVPLRPPSRLHRRQVALLERLARGAIEQVGRRAAERPPRITIGTVTVLVASVAIIAAWLLLLIVGVRLLVGGFGWLAGIAGFVMVLVALVGRPRLAPPPERSVQRENAPELYRLADEIAAALHAPRAAVLGVTGEWNVGTYRFGVRQRVAVELGLPLWSMATGPQRVGLLAHELAHSVNGDTSRSVVQGNALRLLALWAAYTEPDDDLTSGDPGLVGLANIPGNLLMLGLSALLGRLFGMLWLAGYTSRLRAELYADRLAAVVAGRQIAIEALRATRHDGAYLRAVAAMAVRRPPPADLFEELAAQIAATPSSEIERLRRRELRRPYGQDVTHPPMAVRIEMLERLPPSPVARVTVSAEQMRRIDAELAPYRAEIARRLVEDYRDSLSA